MKVLFLNHNVAWSGGTFFRAFAIAREIVRRGHQVCLLTISPTQRWRAEHERVDGVEIVRTPDLLWGVGRTGWDPFDTIWRCAHLRGRRWDVIHAWDSRPAVILPALFARAQNPTAPLFLDWADWWGRGGTQAERTGIAKVFYGPVETYFEEAFRTRAAGTTTISEALLERAVRLGVGRDTIRLLPQGCEVPDDTVPDRATARDRLGIAGDVPLFITVGKTMPADARLLFDAASDVLEQHPDARFVLIGRHGATIPPLLVRSGRVQETGFVTEGVLRDYTGACDALVVALADTIASRARWPSKANAFLAAGRAIAITRVGDLPALLEREHAAFIADPTPRALAQAVLATVREPERRIKCESRARELAREQLAWPIIVSDLLAFYERIVRARTVTALESARSPAT